MINTQSGDEHYVRKTVSPRRIGINITIQEEQRPDENVVDFIDRVAQKVVSVYGHLEAFNLPSVNIDVVPAE